MNGINITYSNTGLGITPNTSPDNVSALIFYTGGVFPSGIQASANTVNIPSLASAVALGINPTNSTSGNSASATTTITASGSTGAIITAQVQTQLWGLVSIGFYTVQSTDTTTTIATGLAASINQNTLNTGFFATSNSTAVSVYAPLQTGLGGNSFSWVNTVSGGITYTTTAWSSGTASVLDGVYYHIEEFFRACQGTSQLYLTIATGTSASSSYAEITNTQLFAVADENPVVQLGIYEPLVAFSTSNLNLIQTQITSLVNNSMPLEVLYTGDISAVSNLSTLTDLTTLGSSCPQVSVWEGQDAGNINIAGGYRVWLANGKTVGTVGFSLGAVSSVAVQQSISCPGLINVDNGIECDVLAFGNGQLISVLGSNLLSQIDAKHYNFLNKYILYPGSFFNGQWTAVNNNSFYNQLSANRVIHKVGKMVRASLVPYISSNIQVNDDGTIALGSITFFKAIAGTPLANMVGLGNISKYSVNINSKQNVQAQGDVLNMVIQIISTALANQIDINLGFVLSLAA